MSPKLFKIAMLVLFLLLNGCGKTPTEPEPVITLFPLASGSRWEYAITEKKHGWASEFRFNSTSMGRAVLEVMEVDEQGADIVSRLAVSFSLDSIHVRVVESYWTDTTYVQYNLFDTTYTITLMKRDGKLYRANSPFLQPFLPVAPVSGSKVNLALYNFGYFDAFDREFPFLSSTDSSFEYGLSDSEQGINAVFIPQRGGLTQLTSSYSLGDMSGHSIDTEINLVTYSPSN